MSKKKNPAQLANELEAAISQEFGFAVSVLIRTRDELAAAIQARMRGKGAQLRGREGAEGRRRAADGAARVMVPAGGQAVQPPWGTRLPRPPLDEWRQQGPGGWSYSAGTPMPPPS